MARSESDREDLWAEAVALTARVELSMPCRPDVVVAGYRDNGWCSLYFGQDVMLQFTPDGGLRRAYLDGDLYRTQGSTLARLHRQRTEHETVLRRHDLTDEELADFRSDVHAVVRELWTALRSGQFAVQRETSPGNEKLTDRLSATLEGVLAAKCFLAAAIPGKR